MLKLSPFWYTVFTIAYLGHSGKILIEIKLLQMYDKGLFICVPCMIFHNNLMFSLFMGRKLLGYEFFRYDVGDIGIDM
jgi:hypothetical protein